MKQRRWMWLSGAAIASSLWSTDALAQTAEPLDSAGRDAKIRVLQSEIDQIQTELNALRGTPAPSASAVPAPAPAQSADNTAPSSAASATLGQAIPGTTRTASGTDRPRIFGAGVPSTGAVSRIDSGHPIIATQDGRFTASLLGVMQFDVADYFQHAAGPIGTDLRRAGAAGDTARARNLSNGTTFRRARIGIAGKAFGDFEYSVLLDFGGSGEEDNGHVQELWLQYSGWKPAHIRVGAFAPFIGLEDAGSTNGMMFLERPASADIARSLAGGDYREAGQIAFTGSRWFASAALTGRLVNTSGSSTVQPYNSQLGLIGRAGVLPIKGKDDLLHVAVHGSYVAHPADTGGPDATATTAISPIQLRERPELRVDGTRLIDTGAIDAAHAYTAGAELAYQHRNFLIQSEYERIGIERRNSPLANPHFDGFYVEGSWMITGQRRRYNDGNYAFDGPKIEGSFNPAKGNWGAWELALRYSDIDLNYRQGAEGSALPLGGVRGGNQKIATAGVNWYLNSIARVMLDYQHVTIDRLSPSATTYQTPVGAEIGQHYDTASARFQLAF
jgi:phosphate-selective porin OprO and OprP